MTIKTTVVCNYCGREALVEPQKHLHSEMLPEGWRFQIGNAEGDVSLMEELHRCPDCVNAPREPKSKEEILREIG